MGPDNSPLWNTLNINTFFRILSDLKVFLLVSEQIAYHFVIDLNVRGSDHESCLKCKNKKYIFILTRLNVAENILNGSWNDTSFIIMHVVSETLHSIRLSGACLAICKYGGIIALKSATYRQPGSILINLLLAGLIIIYIIKGVLVLGVIVGIIDVCFEIFRGQSLQIVILKKLDLFTIGVHLNGWYKNVALELSLQGRPYTDYDFYVIVWAEFALFHLLILLFLLWLSLKFKCLNLNVYRKF